MRRSGFFYRDSFMALERQRQKCFGYLLNMAASVVQEGSGYAISGAKIRVDQHIRRHPFSNPNLRGHMDIMAKRIGFPRQDLGCD
jgi:3-hydroxyacyl-[acyl-carrier-protein] dehydratase